MAIEDCIETETLIKSGKMTDVLGVEMLIIKYSSKCQYMIKSSLIAYKIAIRELWGNQEIFKTIKKLKTMGELLKQLRSLKQLGSF